MDNEARKIRWYEVMYVVVLVGLLGWSVLFMNPHKVAVVDMDRVLKDVGVLQKIDKDRQNKDFFKKGTSYLQGYNARMKNLREKLEDAKTPAEREKIQGQMKTSAEMFQQTIQPIQAEMQQYEAAVVATFRKRLQPIIKDMPLIDSALGGAAVRR